MPRRKELTPQMRSRICELRAQGISYRKIREVHPDLKLSTIRYTCRMEAKRAECVSLPRSGRPRALTEEDRDQIYDTITHKDPHIKMVDLLETVDHKIKEQALRMILREMGRRKWLQRRRPHLKERHARLRLEWAYRYRNQDWKDIVWSDESIVERGAGARPCWTFTRPAD